MLSKISTEPVKTDNYEVGAYIGILHSHINYTSFVGYAVKGGDFSLLLGSKGV
ncbi:hypothetical protein [Segatella copri]|uniref:hypothetical protein n=1 Tax=Segatella copri TaxID=165179 RepID=UPI0016433961|nr:hypothetical protein [Segatella copri]